MASKTGTASVVLVEKRDAKAVKQLLEKEGCLNKDFRMTPCGDLIAIPLRAGVNLSNSNQWGDKIVRTGEHECPYSTAKLGNNRLSVDDNLTRPQQALWNWLNKDVQVKEQILALDIQVCPKKLEVLGDDGTLIISRKAFSLQNEAFKSMVGDNQIDQLWKQLAHDYKSPRVARRGDIDPDSPIRESGHELMWPIQGIPEQTGPGSPGWITVTEQGIRQSFDMTRVMFSRGNITEKIRFGKLVQEGDVMLDMYAGIGYYSLPSLVHGKAAHVYACEWNEHAAFALQYNLKANGVNNRATVFIGDSRKSAKDHNLVDLCDRVSLGLLPSSEGGWRTAVKALRRSTGGWLHVHGNVPEKERQTWTFWVCKSLSLIAEEEVASDWVACCTNVERVKSFAPTVYHYVADVFVGPFDQLEKRGLLVDTMQGRAGILNAGCFEPSPDVMDKPSCALDPNGVLHQEWMMETEV